MSLESLWDTGAGLKADRRLSDTKQKQKQKLDNSHNP